MSKGVLEHTSKEMYIVPVLIGTARPSGIQQYWLFLERNGTHLIQLDATPADAVDAAKSFADANDICLLGEPVLTGNLVFVTVDASKTDLTGFYSWREVPTGTIPSKELWRPFLWVSSNDSADPLGVNKMLDGIAIAEAPHTVSRVISAFRDLKTV